MKLTHTITLGVILTIITLALTTPILSPREDPLSDFIAPKRCQVSFPDHPGYCYFQSLTSPKGTTSVYIHDEHCKLIGYEPGIQPGKEASVTSSLKLPVKVTMKDGGSRPGFTYDGVKFGPGNELHKGRMCKKDEDGVVCAFPWECGDELRRERAAPQWGNNDLRFGCCWDDEKDE